MAYIRLNGIAELGGQELTTAGIGSLEDSIVTFPGCTVTVYTAGTSVLTSIYSDRVGTVKANPFTASSSDASWFFYADAGTYDVRFSGLGIDVPFTLGDVSLGGAASIPAITSLNGITDPSQTFTNSTNITVTSSSGIHADHTFTLTGPIADNLLTSNVPLKQSDNVFVGTNSFLGLPSTGTPIKLGSSTTGQYIGFTPPAALGTGYNIIWPAVPQANGTTGSVKATGGSGTTTLTFNSSALTVVEGGTGRATLLSGALLMGNATTAVTQLTSTHDHWPLVGLDGSFVQEQLTSTAFGTMLDTDTTLAANSDTKIASQKAVKAYVDNAALGLVFHTPVRVATTGNGTLASAYENGDTLDGVVLATNDRILLKDQTTQTENGIYFVNASGAPTRALDADTGAELLHAAVLVSTGTANASTSWVNNNTSAITLGVSNVTFAQFSGANVYTAGSGLVLAGNQFSIGTVTNAMLGNSISASHLAGTDITTIGTITVGTWAGGKIGEVYGGTGNDAYAVGDTLYSGALNGLNRLAGNTTATQKFLTQTGNGSVSAAPSWAALTSGNVTTALGFTPINKAGDTGVGALTLTGLLTLASNGLAVGTNQLVVSGGNVGVGMVPTQKLSAAGIVESTVGGFKFPDGTIQITASLGAVTGPERQISEFADFPTAVSTIGATATTLIVNSVCTYSSTVTVPSTLMIRLTGGGQLAPSAGTTSIPLKNLIAPASRQIFAGAGSIRLTGGGDVWASWFAGADASVKVQAADTALDTNKGTIRWEGSDNWSTSVTLNSDHVLQLGAGTLTTTVGTGVYPIKLKSRTAVRGAGMHQTVITEPTYNTGSAGTAWLAVIFSFGNTSYPFEAQDDDLEVSDLQILGANTYGDGGILSAIAIGNGKNCIISRVFINGTKGLGITIGASNGVTGDSIVRTRDGFKVIDCTFRNVWGQNLSVVNGRNGTLANNNFFDMQLTGTVIDLEGNTDKDFLENITITNNTIDTRNTPASNYPNAIGVTNSNNSPYVGNISIIGNTHIGGKVTDSDGAITVTSGISIYTTNVKSVIIANNLCRRDGQLGAFVLTGDRHLVTGNIIESSSGGGSPAMTLQLADSRIANNLLLTRINSVYTAGGASDVIKEDTLAFSSTVNTSGTLVTRTAGSTFRNYPTLKGQTITINSVPYTVSSVTNATVLVLTTSAGTQTGVTATIPVASLFDRNTYEGNESDYTAWTGTNATNPVVLTGTNSKIISHHDRTSGKTYNGTINSFSANIGFGGITSPATAVEVSGVTRSSGLQDKGVSGQVFNAVAYGADNTGASDVRTAFDAAVTAMPASGGTLYLPPGTYLMTGAWQPSKSNLHVKGAGRGASVIKRGPVLTGTTMLAPTGNSVTFSNLTVDGNGLVNTANSSAEFLVLNIQDFTADNIEVKNYRYGAFNMQDSTLGTKNIKVVNSQFTGLADPTILQYTILVFAADASHRVTGVTIRGNTFRDSGGPCFAAFGAFPEIVDLNFIGNYVYNNHLQSTPSGGGQMAVAGYNSLVADNTFGAGGPGSTGIEHNGGYATISGNTIYNQAGWGIYVAQNPSTYKYTTVTDNHIRGNGSDGIYVSNSANNVIITGNTTNENAGYGINIGTGVNNFVIANNDAMGNTTGAINNASPTATNGSVVNNLGHIMWRSGTGVPSGVPTNGSLFSRTDGTGTSLYCVKNGAWVAVN